VALLSGGQVADRIFVGGGVSFVGFVPLYPLPRGLEVPFPLHLVIFDVLKRRVLKDRYGVPCLAEQFLSKAATRQQDSEGVSLIADLLVALRQGIMHRDEVRERLPDNIAVPPGDGGSLTLLGHLVIPPSYSAFARWARLAWWLQYRLEFTSMLAAQRPVARGNVPDLLVVQAHAQGRL
jgi:hypothetical protein